MPPPILTTIRHALASLSVAILLAPAAAMLAAAAAPAAAAEPGAAEPRWVDVTNDLANDSWGAGGVTLVAAVPGTDRVIAGVSGRWLWASANGGASWSALGAIGNAKNLPSSIVFDGSDAFWATSSAGSPGAFATIDGGTTFKPVPNVEAADAISVDATDPKHRTVMIGPHQKEHDVEISTNGGAFFSKAAKFPGTTGYTGQVLALDDKTWLASAAGFDRKSKKEKEVGIWRTEDAGKSWTKVHNRGATAPAFVASNGAIYWACGGTSYGGTPESGIGDEAECLLRSNNRGKSWTSLDAAVKHSAMELPQRWLAAIGDQQLLVSSDGGDSWDAVGEKLPFQPNGAVYCEKRHAVFAWRSTAGYQKESVMRLDLPEHLDELVNPRIARDVVAWDGEAKTFLVCWGNKDAGTFGPQSAVARQGSTALLWHVAFANTFTNCGAIWCTSPVDPRNEVDASGCKNLVLSVKAEGANKPASLRVLLSSVVGTTDKNVNSSEVDLLKYCPKAYDGTWHDVAIPLADFTGADFSTKQLCAMVINAHTGANGFAFDLYIDGIGFSK